MTTIAYKDGVLAYDSLVSKGTSRIGDMQKGIKTDKYLAAVCGSAEAVPLFLKWVKNDFDPEKKPEFDIKTEEDEFEAIVIDKAGNITFYSEKLNALPIEADYHAIGSGEDFAKGIMWHGGTAEDALRGAKEHDTSTGGRIRVLTFNEQ